MLPRVYLLSIITLAALVIDVMPRHETSGGSASPSRKSSSVSTDQTDDQEPDVHEFCAPCDEIDFGKDSGVQCDPAVLESESFEQCRMSCESILNVDNEAMMSGKTKSKVTRAKENCRCLCKSLKLRNCDETVCNKRFNEVKCASESSAQQGSQRCFERVFNDEDSYNRCVSMDSLAPPTTNLPDEQGGIEQCSCTCNFLQSQAPTGAVNTSSMTTVPMTTVPVTEDPCSVDYDCSLTLRQERKIRRGLDDNEGNSFGECRSNCEAEYETEEDESGKSRRSRSRSDSTNSISSSDCECYCLMIHDDPCPNSNTTGDTEIDDDVDSSWSSTTKRARSTPRSPGPRTRTDTDDDRRTTPRSPGPRTRTDTDDDRRTSPSRSTRRSSKKKTSRSREDIDHRQTTETDVRPTVRT